MVCLSAYGHEKYVLGNIMNRRSFFKFGITKSREAAINIARVGLRMKFKRSFIRPPGAISEETFLLTCTRCGDCKPACPHDAIHLINEVSAGVQNRTPFVDPYFKACQYCKDMPCIIACEPKALDFPIQGPIKLGVARFVPEHCLVSQGQICDYCSNQCPDGVKALSMDANKVPGIDQATCVGCGKCAYICVSQSGRAIEIDPV
jgi:ferredoxin-type protein NapG